MLDWFKLSRKYNFFSFKLIFYFLNLNLEQEQCKNQKSIECATNAILFTDNDRCGEPIQRCECLAGYEGDGYNECKGLLLFFLI